MSTRTSSTDLLPYQWCNSGVKDTCRVVRLTVIDSNEERKKAVADIGQTLVITDKEGGGVVCRWGLGQVERALGQAVFITPIEWIRARLRWGWATGNEPVIGGDTGGWRIIPKIIVSDPYRAIGGNMDGRQDGLLIERRGSAGWGLVDPNRG